MQWLFITQVKLWMTGAYEFLNAVVLTILNVNEPDQWNAWMLCASPEMTYLLASDVNFQKFSSFVSYPPEEVDDPPFHKIVF